jgi:FixJ family two-component response regulator
MSATADIVFVVEDDPSILKALERLLGAAGFDVRGFLSAQAFLEHHDPATPGCALFDVAMEGLDGLELQRRLIESGCGRPVVFLTGRGDIPMSVRAIKAGATNFLTKPVASGELLDAIRAALEKDHATRPAYMERDAIKRRLARLTPREYEVFHHVVAGRLNKQIAGALGTVEKTIKVHRSRLMKKLAVRSVADLVRLSERAAITPGDGPRRA